MSKLRPSRTTKCCELCAAIVLQTEEGNVKYRCSNPNCALASGDLSPIVWSRLAVAYRIVRNRAEKAELMLVSEYIEKTDRQAKRTAARIEDRMSDLGRQIGYLQQRNKTLSAEVASRAKELETWRTEAEDERRVRIHLENEIATLLAEKESRNGANNQGQDCPSPFLDSDRGNSPSVSGPACPPPGSVASEGREGTSQTSLRDRGMDPSRQGD